MSLENNPQPIYSPENDSERQHINLTEEQKQTVRNITLGIEEVDEQVREMAVDDVIKTLESGHPLNRLIADEEGQVTGYVACEDFVPGEAYIKYLGTTGSTGRNLFKEIPAFFEFAKARGYKKLNFHGWNKDLNHALEHFGFQRLRTDKMGELAADFYEKILTEPKTAEEINQERIQAFEQKYLQKLEQDYQQTLKTFSEENRPKKEQSITEAYQNLSQRLQNEEGFEWNDRTAAILRLKLARYLQGNETVDLSTLYDAILETPKFIQNDKGSFFRLFELHEEKTVQKIAEMRKKRAEMTGDESFNPYEALVQTNDGRYYLARLLNMPHLEQESEYMNHCVGTSNSYINQIKRGDIEILSFRTLPQLNPETHQLEGEDRPIMTIEYNLRTNTIEQMKKADDEYLDPSDPYFQAVIELLGKLRQTETDMGKPRDFKKIASSELQNIEVPVWHVLTQKGQINFREFALDTGDFILKAGEMPITAETSKEDIVKIVRILEGIQVNVAEIAHTENEVTENTKFYIGPFSIKILQQYPNLEYYYTAFPEGRIQQGDLEIGGLNQGELQSQLEEVCRRADGSKNISNDAQDMLDKMYADPEFQERSKYKEQIQTVRLRVADLGFESGASTDQIYTRAVELGLELCPPEVGPYQRIKDQDQPMGEWYRIAMKQITGWYGGPNVFSLLHDGSGLWLSNDWAHPTHRWNLGRAFMFRLPQVSHES